MERSLTSNANLVIPANVELINAIGEMAGGILPIPRKEEAKK